MRLRRIEVRDFRKLGHVVVDGLADGLNVVVGDNEAGKSTLLAALRAVLFERHRLTGERAQAMLPYGQAVRPTIEIGFDIGKDSWQLRKSFCQRPEAELSAARLRFTGDEVEDHLATLLGFTPPGKGGSDPERHHGIHGLLWVEQGKAHVAPQAGGGRDAIASALEAEVGQVVGGERGRFLLARAKERKDAFFTDRTERPKGAWKALGDAVEALEERRQGLARDLAKLNEDVTRLQACTDRLARHARDATHEAAITARRQAEALLKEIAHLSERLDEADRERARRTVPLAAARDRMAGRAKAVERVGLAEARHAKAKAEADAAQSDLHYAREERSRAEVALDAARAAAEAAERRVAAIAAALERNRAEGELRRLDDQLAKAEEAERTRLDRVAAAEAMAIDEKMLAALEASQGKVDKARARRDAASVRIAFEPEGARAVAIEGTPHDARTPVFLAEDTRLALEGFGHVVVRPGGGAAELARDLAEAERRQAEELRRAGFADVAAAREALRQKLAARAEAEAAARLVAAIAAQGLGSLRSEIAKLRAVVSRPLPAEAMAILAPTEEALTEARLAAASAAAAERARAATADLARKRCAGIEIDEARAVERLRGADAELATSRADLASARAAASDDDLATSVSDAEAALTEAERRQREASDAVSNAEPEIAQLRFKQADAAEKAIREDIQRLRDEKLGLEAALRARGHDGLGEQLAEVEGELALKQQQLAALSLEARAARLLHETLAAAQREAKERWLAPVREKVKPYLRLLQPDSDILLSDDTFEIQGVVRNGITEPFTGLSIGAREQMAVITRLALADILVGAGLPGVVILDDALVNSDEERLERMQLALQKASANLQILILTCRERDFLKLGAPIKRIA